MPSRPAETRQNVVIVTGMNGAGKTTALKAFEDLGYEAVDNLPLSLLDRLLRTEDDAGEDREQRPLAIGVDSRTRAFNATTFLAQLTALERRGDFEACVVFFDCSDEELAQRFSETRRRHPLAGDRPVTDGIAREREIMAPIRARADQIFDTTGETIHELKRRLSQRFAPEEGTRLAITVMSFGYGRGLPRDADLVFDVRFLRNPNYVAELKPETGRAEAVAAYICADPHFAGFFDRLSGLVTDLLPLYEDEGKSHLTIACGCTGGRHRSVFVCEMLARVLAERGYRATLRHREVDPETGRARREKGKTGV